MAGIIKFLLFLISRAAKLGLNSRIIYLYRRGDEGYFMGMSYGVDPDRETIGAGIFIGYIIFTILNSIELCFQQFRRGKLKLGLSNILMNLVGGILWATTGMLAILWWKDYNPSSNNWILKPHPNQAGIEMGTLALVNSLFYFGEFVLQIVIGVISSEEYIDVPQMEETTRSSS